MPRPPQQSPRPPSSLQHQKAASLPRKNKLDHLEEIGDALANVGHTHNHRGLVPPPTILVNSRLSAELDLDNLDIRNIDPVLASKLLDEIRQGADVGPLLERFKSVDLHDRPHLERFKAVDLSAGAKPEKKVSFEDDHFNPEKLGAVNLSPKLSPGDIFM